MHRRHFMTLAVLSATGLGRAQDRTAVPVYFGTYTSNTKSRGIYASSLDMSTGALTAPELVAETPNPSFLAIHPGGRYLYAVNEVNEIDGTKAGGVSAFSRDPGGGALRPLNRQPSGGPGPAHISADRGGSHVLVANYGGGSVAVLPVGGDGRLQSPSSVVQHAGSSVDPQRQKAPHAHCIVVDANNRFAYAVDLGLDKILVYRFDAAKGILTPNDPPFVEVEPGSGPRHFVFDQKGRFAYVINELKCTITAFEHQASRGTLTALQTLSTLPPGQAVEKGFSTAEIQVHPSGLFLYGSNRGHDTLAVFSIDQKSGRLTHLQHESTQGSTPRNFGIDPTGRYLLAANQRSDSVIVFRIDEKSGRLSPAGQRIDVPAPVCVKFVAAQSGKAVGPDKPAPGRF